MAWGTKHNIELYVRSMGKLLKVEAVFPETPEGTDAANTCMTRHDHLAVVAATDGLILLADRFDTGLKVQK